MFEDINGKSNCCNNAHHVPSGVDCMLETGAVTGSITLTLLNAAGGLIDESL